MHISPRIPNRVTYLLDCTLKFIGASCALLFGIWAPLSYRLQSEGNKVNDEEMKKLQNEVREFNIQLRAIGVLKALEFCEQKQSQSNACKNLMVNFDLDEVVSHFRRVDGAEKEHVSTGHADVQSTGTIAFDGNESAERSKSRVSDMPTATSDTYVSFLDTDTPTFYVGAWPTWSGGAWSATRKIASSRSKEPEQPSVTAAPSIEASITSVLTVTKPPTGSVRFDPLLEDADVIDLSSATYMRPMPKTGDLISTMISATIRSFTTKSYSRIGMIGYMDGEFEPWGSVYYGGHGHRTSPDVETVVGAGVSSALLVGVICMLVVGNGLFRGRSRG